MTTLDYQKLGVVNKTRSTPAWRDWRGQFTPEFVERYLPKALDLR